MRPRLLDAYCCEGGASMGYRRAGFEVFGVDKFELYSQRRYPFPSHKGDAVEFIKEHGHRFDAIAGSPPCQKHTAGTRAQDRTRYEDWIARTRDAMVATGKPYVIENVVGAPLLHPRGGSLIMLCGRQFDLTAWDSDGVKLHLDRHRLFESNVPIDPPPSCLPHDTNLQVGGSYGGARRDKHEARHVRGGGYVPSFQVQQRLLGITWTTQRGLHQAIPPAYTEYIGKQLLRRL
jgi:DNA (cytosine-5)-methyltransferase 1